MPFSDQLKQLVELHRVAELAMKDLLIRLWPAEAIPSSYFGLVKRLVNACPRLDAIKRSVCIEGARMAFARVKVQWAKMNAVKLATEGPPAGKEHRTPERYFDDVLEGSRTVAEQCAKDIIFEIHSCCPALYGETKLICNIMLVIFKILPPVRLFLLNLRVGQSSASAPT